MLDLSPYQSNYLVLHDFKNIYLICRMNAMRALLLLFLILTNQHALAALNKWVDSKGQVHYSDSPPPPDVQATTLRGSHSTPTPMETGKSEKTGAEPKSIAEEEADLKKAQQEKKAAEEKAAKDLAYQESLKASCTAAQQNLQILQRGTRIMQLDANGEPSYLEDDQRQQNIEKAKQDIANYCK